MRPRFLFPILCCLAVSVVSLAQSNVQSAPAPGNTGQAVNAPDQPSTVPGKASADAPIAAAAADKTSGKSTTPASGRETATKPESDHAATIGAPAEPPAAPTTTILDHSDRPTTTSVNSDGHDPYLDVPPMPTGKVTLIGGFVRKVDRIRDRIALQPFGGKPMTVRFDERTHIYRDGIETTQLGVKKGDRIYVDTMLDKSEVFARNIHVITESRPADARGQLISFNPRNQMMVLQDELSGQPVRFRLDNTTSIKKGTANGSTADLEPGALIAVHFAPDNRNRDAAREITVYAIPGQQYTFAGDVTHLNVATGMLAVHNLSDNKSYEITFDPATLPNRDDLTVGAQVNIRALFTGHGYKAQQVAITQTAAKEQ